MGFDSDYFDLAIGMAVVFFLASLVVSGLNEGLSWATKLRAQVLWAYLHDLLATTGEKQRLPQGGVGAFHLMFLRIKKGLTWVVQLLKLGKNMDADPTNRDVRPAPEGTGSSTDDKLRSLLDKLKPLDLAQSMGAEKKTTVKQIPPASLAQAFLEVFADTGRQQLARGLPGLVSSSQDERDKAAVDIARVLAAPDRPAEATEAMFKTFSSAVADAGDVAAKEQAADDLVSKLAGLSGAQADPSLGTALRELAASSESSAQEVAAAKVISALARAFPTSLPRQRMEAAIADLGGAPLAPTLKRLWDTSMGETDKFRAQLETWLDSEMNRLGGYYKRSIRFVMAVLAVLVALVLNVDALRLANDLRENPEGLARLTALADEAAQPGDSVPPSLIALREQCQKEAEASPEPDPGAAFVELRSCITDRLDALSGLGVIDRNLLQGFDRWWEDFYPLDEGGPSTWGWLGHLIGVALTALALFLGAPFWFDIIKRLTGVRKRLVGEA